MDSGRQRSQEGEEEQDIYFTERSAKCFHSFTVPMLFSILYLIKLLLTSSCFVFSHEKWHIVAQF